MRLRASQSYPDQRSPARSRRVGVATTASGAGTEGGAPAPAGTTPRSPAASPATLLALLPPLAQLTGNDMGLLPPAEKQLRTLVDQVLRRQNLRPEVWAETVLTLVHRTCTTLRTDVRHGTGNAQYIRSLVGVPWGG